MNGLTIKYMERTYEELRSMSQEDLVRLALEYQEEILYWMNRCKETDDVLFNMKQFLANIFKDCEF
jgi:hypothetical protein